MNEAKCEDHFSHLSVTRTLNILNIHSFHFIHNSYLLTPNCTRDSCDCNFFSGHKKSVLIAAFRVVSKFHNKTCVTSFVRQIPLLDE